MQEQTKPTFRTTRIPGGFNSIEAQARFAAKHNPKAHIGSNPYPPNSSAWRDWHYAFSDALTATLRG